MPTLRILHISDLHERGTRESEAWRRRRVLGESWSANLRAIRDESEGEFHLVCFTGDLADWGTEPEFASGIGFLVQALDVLSVPAERLFVVPGNHDVDRGAQAENARFLICARNSSGAILSSSRAGLRDSGRRLAI